MAALSFAGCAGARYQGGPTADISRIGRRQKWCGPVWRNIETNMNSLELARFAVRMRLPGGVEAEIYPGAPQYIDGISYWVPDRETIE